MCGNDLIVAYQYAVAARPGWEETMARYGVRTALTGGASPLATAMRRHEDWQEVYADEMASIFVRDEGTSQPAPQ
jgi:hypothetical protein